jgi:hypothetical protein
MIGGTICRHLIGVAAGTSGRVRRGPLTSMLNRPINRRNAEVVAAVTAYYTYLQVTRPTAGPCNNASDAAVDR